MNGLGFIYRQYPSIREDKELLKRYLSEIYPDDVLTQNLLSLCVDEKIPIEIESIDHVGAVQRKNLVDKLKSAYGIEEDKAQKAVMMWIEAIKRPYEYAGGIPKKDDEKIFIIIDEMLSLASFFHDRIPPKVYAFLAEDLSKEESDDVIRILNKIGIIVFEPTVEYFRFDLKSILYDDSIEHDRLYKRALISMWRLDHLDRKLDRPLSATDVCKEVGMQGFDFECGGIYKGAVRYAHKLLVRHNKDYTWLLKRHGLL